MQCQRTDSPKSISYKIACPHCHTPYCCDECRVQHWTETHQYSCIEYQNFKLEDLEEVSDTGLKILGRGSYGEVKLFKHIKTSTLYAVKIISKNFIKKRSSIPNLLREIKVHKTLCHPSIIQLIKYFEDDEKVYIVLEYASRGSLFRMIRKRKALEESNAWKYFSETCLGMKYLHDKEIVHRDLKPENILLDKYDHVKICDFGWCVQGSDMRKTFCGTLDYMAPEMILGEGHSYQVDLWALGVLLYELLHGRAPFQGNDEEKRQNIIKNEIEFDEKVSHLAKDLILKLVKRNPKERIPLDNVLAHPWIEKFVGSHGVRLGMRVNHPRFEIGEVVEVSGLICKVKFWDKLCFIAIPDVSLLLEKQELTIADMEKEAFDSLERWLNIPVKKREKKKENVNGGNEIVDEVKGNDGKINRNSIKCFEDGGKKEPVEEMNADFKKMEDGNREDDEVQEIRNSAAKSDEFSGVFNDKNEMKIMIHNREKNGKFMKSALTGKIKVPKESNYGEFYTTDSTSFQNVFNITNKIDISEEAFEQKKEQLENIRKTLEIANRPKTNDKKTGFWEGFFGCLHR